MKNNDSVYDTKNALKRSKERGCAHFNGDTPRTLHMSMLGVRDLSVIETPPENRFPVQTYVLEQNTNFIKEALERIVS